MIKPISILLIGVCSLCACINGSNTSGNDSNSNKEVVSNPDIRSSINEGKILFEHHCEYCHGNPDKGTKDTYTFDHFFDNYPSPGEVYFTKYLKDSKKLKEAGDSFAISIDKEYNSMYEHLFKDSLTEQDFNDLILFIKSVKHQNRTWSK